MANLKPLSQKQFLVEIDKLAGAKFTKATGLEETFDEAEYNDGSTGQQFTHLGMLKLGSVTLGKPFDAEADQAIYDWFQEYKENRGDFAVTITPILPTLEAKQVPGSKSLILQGCQVKRFKYPDADREGSGLAMLELEVIPTTCDRQ